MSLRVSKLKFFFLFLERRGSIALLSLGGPCLSRSRLFRSRSVGREPLSRSAFRTCRKFAEATCRWRFSSYFRGHDSACHGPIVPFFILRRVSTACERKGIRFGFLSDYHNDALQWIRSVYIPNTSLWNAKASLKCWNISDNSTFSILDVAGLNKCC